MSIHVSVSSNPIFVDRGKVLFTDIETARRNELQRRRKIRLQQVRQQSKDLSCKVRQKVSSEASSIGKKEKEKKCAQEKIHKHEKVDQLRQEVEECLSSVGSGHQLATLQAECDELLREKQELREEIARARGAIAEERLKAEKCIQKEKAASTVGRKQLVRKVENLRSTLISNMPQTRSATASGPRTVQVQVHRGADGCFQERTSAKFNKKNTSEAQASDSRGVYRKPGTLSDLEDSCDESDDDSDVTWPPRSVKVTRERIPSPKVRFYDHNTRVAKECPKPSYNVIPGDPSCQPDMSDVIADEEHAMTFKENMNVLTRRENLIRGSKALRKEREKREAEALLKEIGEIEKRRKVQLALSKTYPSKFHERDHLRATACEGVQDDESEVAVVHKEPIPSMKDFPSSKPMQNVTLRPILENHIPVEPTDKTGTEELLEDLIHKLKEERARKQKKLDHRFGVSDLKEDEIPVWVRDKEEDNGASNLESQRWNEILNKSLEGGEQRQSFEEAVVLKGRTSRTSSGEQRDSQEHSKCSPAKDRRKSSPMNKSKLSPSKYGSLSKNNIKTTSTVSPDNDNVARKRLDFSKSCSCCENCLCTTELPAKSDANENKIKEQGSPKHAKSLNSTKFDKGEIYKSSKGGITNHLVAAEFNQETASTTSESSSHPETIKSCLRYEGVKVVVKVTDHNKKEKQELPGKIYSDKDVQTSLQDSSKSDSPNSKAINEVTSSSTSYRSLPPKLSPQHQAIIHSLLTRPEARNINPALLSYITRLLGLTRESIDNLPCSSVSEVSISSSVFEHSDQGRSSSVPKKYDASCQAETDGVYPEEVLKFSEVAKTYVNRVNDLAGMLESLNLLPCRKKEEPEDTAYVDLPEDVRVSIKLSNSVREGQYPEPLDVSEFPTSLQPHPSTFSKQQALPYRNYNRRPKSEDSDHLNLPRTAQETGTPQKTPRHCENLKDFDPNVSSIKGSPKRGELPQDKMNSSASSLCLLDDRDIDSSFFGSSSDDFEDVFRSLGIGWALPTVRKVREARKKAETTSSDGGCGGYSHSTPLTQSPVRMSTARRGSVKSSGMAGPASDATASRAIASRATASGAQTTSARLHPPRPPSLCDSDSLTPPTFSLNIPKLSKALTQSP